MKRSLHSNANAGGGGYGYPAGPPAHASQHQQTQQQYSQQPQFRGQWNDYGSRNNNQYSQPQYSEYSQTQQTQPSQPLDTRRTDHYQHHIRHDTSRSDNPNNYSSPLTNDQSMSQPAGQQPKRLRATKRRLRQPLSGPAGIWFRMNKKEQAKDSKEGIKTERKSGAGDDAISGDDDTFGYEEAGVIAHQAHQAMAEHNRRERERREEEEMKGSGGDEDDVEEMLDEETGQICKVPEGTVSTFEAVLGRAWDVMCTVWTVSCRTRRSSCRIIRGNPTARSDRRWMTVPAGSCVISVSSVRSWEKTVPTGISAFRGRAGRSVSVIWWCLLPRSTTTTIAIGP